MKVLLFSHEFPPMVGGAGTYAFELARGLYNLNNEVTVLCGRTQNNNKDLQVDSGLSEYYDIKVVRKKWQNKLWFLYWKYVFNRFVEKTGPYDLILFANYTANIIGSKLVTEKLGDYFITIHGTDIDYFFLQRRLKDKLMFNQKRMIMFFENAKKVISVSDYLKNDLLKYLPQLNNVKTVYHGIDLEKFKPLHENEEKKLKNAFLKKYGFTDNHHIILCSARLVEGKGHDILLRAFSEACKLQKNVVLVLAGDGQLRNQLDDFARKLNITSKIIFLGNVLRDELIKIYQICDIFVMVSRRLGETFGIVFIEAMACKKPIIGGDIGAISEIIENDYNGFVVDPLSVIECKNRIVELINDNSKRINLGKNGYESVKKKFNNHLMAQNTLI